MSHTNVPPGQPHADDSDGFGRPSAEALKLGYEPDGYDTTSVVSVPVLVVGFFILAFLSTTILFAYFKSANNDNDVHPMAQKRNGAPLNDRLGRIDRETGEVKAASSRQPRLEPLRERGPYSRSITSPEVGKNPPYLHPEDTRAEPGRTDELYQKAPAKPLDQIIAAADKGRFLVQDHPSSPIRSNRLPTAANGGRGSEHSVAEPPELAVQPEVDAPKKGEAPAPKKVAPGEVKP